MLVITATERRSKFRFYSKKDNPFNLFAVKVIDLNSGRIVAHLPMERSGTTEFLLVRSARNISKLTSTVTLFHLLCREG